MNDNAAGAARVRAPARVNLIGEHTDYNLGFVLPVALRREIVAEGSARGDGTVVMRAGDFDEQASFRLEDIKFDPARPWANYVKGVAHFLLARGAPLTGADISISGDIPLGAGLSSSAALEVASALLFQELCGFRLPPEETARLCQKAENEFVGMRCGLMDQFACCLGKKGAALFLDCRSEEYSYVPLDDSIKIVVCNTGLGRELASSEYNKRRGECEEAARLLSDAVPGIESLRDASGMDFEQLGHLLPGVLFKRCRHVVSENSRVLESVEAMKKSDYGRMGGLMLESHRSLRDDYQVSCPELDIMVEAAMSVGGVLGSKMTGAGFGGCTVSLVEECALGEFMEKVGKKYLDETGIEPDIYACESADGAGPVG